MNSATFYRGTGSSSKLFRKIPKISNFSKHCILEHGIEKSRREKNFIISLPSTRRLILTASLDLSRSAGKGGGRGNCTSCISRIRRKRMRSGTRRGRLNRASGRNFIAQSKYVAATAAAFGFLWHG